jgi:uncharacterized protein (DUF697 family)
MTVEAPAEVPATSSKTGVFSRLETARATIRHYTGWSAGAGFVPVPLVDMLLLMGVQFQMLRKLSDLYGVEFSEHIAKNLVGVLLGGLLPQTLSASLLGPVYRNLPGIGPLLGMIAVPAFYAAATHAVGQVFLQHFESGGTFLTFDPDKVRDYFRKEFDAARAKNAANVS